MPFPFFGVFEYSVVPPLGTLPPLGTNTFFSTPANTVGPKFWIYDCKHIIHV
jgi:hypothetical protein